MEQRVVDRHGDRCVVGDEQAHDEAGEDGTDLLDRPGGVGEEAMRPVVAPGLDRPAPTSIPHTVRRAVWDTSPQARAQNTGNVHAEKQPRKAASRSASDGGSATATSLARW